VKLFFCTDHIFLVSDLVVMVYTLEFDTLCHGFSLHTRLHHLLNGKGLLYCTHCKAFMFIKGIQAGLVCIAKRKVCVCCCKLGAMGGNVI